MTATLIIQNTLLLNLIFNLTKSFNYSIQQCSNNQSLDIETLSAIWLASKADLSIWQWLSMNILMILVMKTCLSPLNTTANQQTFWLNDNLIDEDVSKSSWTISNLIDQWKSILSSRTISTA